MARKRLTSLPEGLWSKLAELEAYVRQLDIVRGFGWTLAIAAIALGLGLLADIALELPLSVRIGLLAAAILATLASSYGMIWRPWRRHRSVLDLAAVVERAHPELKESLVSCIELYDTAIPESERGSSLMRELAAKQALQNVSLLDFCDAVSSRPAHRMAIGGLLAWALLLVPLMIPSNYRLLMSRFFTPWQNLDRVTSFSFEVERGDRVVVRGSDVMIAAHPKGAVRDLPPTAELHWVNDQGESDERRVDFDATTGLYSTTIPHVMHGFEYHLSGAGNRSRTYQIQVVEAPAITGVKVEIQPPAYTGQPAKMLEGAAGEITVLERSRLKWELTFNKPLRAAEWQWQNERTASQPASPAPNASQPPPPAAAEKLPPAIPFKLAADRLSATWESVPEQGGMFRLVVRDEHGLTNEADGTRQLVVTPDLAPTITVSGVHASEVAQASDVIPVKVVAEDDVGLGALELHYEIGPTRKGMLKCEASKLGKPRVEHQFDLHLTDLQLRNGELVSYRIRATDERPVPGPNETWSDQRMIRIDAKAKPPGTQQLALDQEQMEKFLKQLHGDVTAQQQQAQKLKKQAEDLPKDDPAAAEEMKAAVEKAADQQAKLHARLEQLAAAFENHPLFANLAEQAQQLAASEFTKAQENLSEAEQAAGQERTDKLEAAQEQLAKAGERLAALEQRFDKLAQLERDLLELNRLAANAEQLAQRMKALDQKQREPAPLQESAQEREHREQLQKAAENQLVAQQQELTDKARELLQKRPELQQAARQQQMQQLAQLTEQAEQLAQPQQALANELQAAAEKTARDSEKFAERQAELQKKIEKLNEQVAEKRPQGVQPIDPMALEKALDELRAGNLGEAAQEEERLAKQLEELEKKLQEAHQTTVEQAQQLADQQAGAAKAARESAKQEAAPTKEEQEAAAEQLKEAAEELRKLSPEQAEAEKQAAEEALAAATEKQEKLAERSTQPDPESKATPEEREQELQRLLKENAEAQEAAAESLQKLADELKPPASEKDADKSDNTSKNEQPEQNSGRPQSKAEQAGRLAHEARDLQEDLAQAQQAQDLSQQRAQQKQLAETLEKLNEEIRRASERMQQASGAADQSSQEKTSKKSDTPAGNQTPGTPSDPSGKQSQNQQAQAAMEEAQRQLQQGNPERSAQAGQKAAEALQQLAQQRSPRENREPADGQPSSEKSANPRPMPADGPQAENGNRNAPEGAVPPAAAAQVTDAVRQLQEALSQPSAGQTSRPDEGAATPKSSQGQRSSGQTRSTASRTPQPSDSPAQGKPGGPSESGASSNSGQVGQESPNSGTPGSASQPAPPSAMQSAAQRLQQAATALRQAQAQWQSKGSGSGQQQAAESSEGAPGAEGQGVPGKIAGDGNLGPTGDANVDTTNLARLKKRLAGRKWGELPGTLQTEILQAAQKKPNSEYGELIRQYFKEIAKTQPATTKP